MPVPVVSAILLNVAGEVLLQLRDDRPDLLWPGHWTLPGGQVEPGETPDQAIARELAEEMELSIPLILWKTYEAPRGGGSDAIAAEHIYTGRLDVSAASIPLHEGQLVAFFDPSKLRGVAIAFGYGALLEALFVQQGNP